MMIWMTCSPTAREAGLNPIVCSAYRTEATQTRLYRNKVARVRASGVPEDRWRRRPPGGWPSPAPASTRPAWLWTL